MGDVPPGKYNQSNKLVGRYCSIGNLEKQELEPSIFIE